MQKVDAGAHAELLQFAETIKDDGGRYRALYFRFSSLSAQFRSDYQIKIAFNIAYDLTANENGAIFLLDNCDIFLICEKDNRAVTDKTLFQLRYLFMDDPLAYNDDGYENPDFCTEYDLDGDWEAFCVLLLSYVGAEETAQDALTKAPAAHEITAVDTPRAETPFPAQPKKLLLTPAYLQETVDFIHFCDIEQCIRSQPVCLFSGEEAYKHVFSEMYINISHLEETLPRPLDIKSNKALFYYITEFLDRRLLRHLEENGAEAHGNKPFSVNLNCRSLISDAFAAFDASLPDDFKKRVIIEIHISDIFSDPASYALTRDILRRKGYRICLDGADIVSLTQINRAALGCDLVKIAWSDAMPDASAEATVAFEKALGICDPSRAVLCRCDSETAVEYGKQRGITLFQGRHIDKILDPAALPVN